MKYTRRCRVCATEFETTHHSRELCSDECKKINRRAVRKATDAKNRDMINARQREWSKAHYDPVKQSARYQERKAGRVNGDLLRKYGITLSEYESLLEEQGGVCAICASPPTTKRLAVDHCHTTGEVRGLLCERCNRGIGLLGDSLERVESAARYLQGQTKEPR